LVHLAFELLVGRPHPCATLLAAEELVSWIGRGRVIEDVDEGVKAGCAGHGPRSVYRSSQLARPRPPFRLWSGPNVKRAGGPRGDSALAPRAWRVADFRSPGALFPRPRGASKRNAHRCGSMSPDGAPVV